MESVEKSFERLTLVQSQNEFSPITRRVSINEKNNIQLPSNDKENTTTSQKEGPLTMSSQRARRRLGHSTSNFNKLANISTQSRTSLKKSNSSRQKRKSVTWQRHTSNDIVELLDESEGPLMAPHKSPHKRDKTKASPAAPAVQARRLSSDTPQQVSATSSATSSAASSRVLTATPKSKSNVSALRNDDDGGDDFFSPYKPPSRTASYRRAPGDDPAAKRRPKSCVMRAPLTSPEQTFARNEPTDALHSLRLASRLERGMNHISPQQLAALITGKHDEHYDRIIVIDARFDYEYNGGHVRGAVNCATPEALHELLQANPPEEGGARICIVFHCEFSSQRAPRLYRLLRQWDRACHAASYPQLYYPELYLLRGGYKNFFNKCIHLCQPQAYQPMFDNGFKKEMKDGMQTIARSKQRRSMSFNNIDEYDGLRRSLKW